MKTLISIFIMIFACACSQNDPPPAIAASANRTVLTFHNTETATIINDPVTTDEIEATNTSYQTLQELSCVDHFYIGNGVIVTTHLPQNQIDSSSTLIHELLKSAYDWADVNYPKAIADDWEHGTSREYGRPNEITIKVHFFDNCNSEKAYLYMEYNVYTDPNGVFQVK